MPGGQYLRRIAEQFSVTTDWLLGIEGAPMYPKQRRTQSELKEDLTEHLKRVVSSRLNSAMKPLVPIHPRYVDADPTRLLAEIENAQVNQVTGTWFHHVPALTVSDAYFKDSVRKA